MMSLVIETRLDYFLFVGLGVPFCILLNLHQPFHNIINTTLWVDLHLRIGIKQPDFILKCKQNTIIRKLWLILLTPYFLKQTDIPEVYLE